MGTSLTGLTPATTYDALIKVGDNGPIDGTLKALSDGLGNDLPMQASTAAVNFTGALTQSGVALQPVLVSGTNIKTINSTTLLGSGDVAVQSTLVSGTNIKTINSTSLLGSGDITISASPSGVSGAIQFSNGSAFASDASNFFWDDTNNRLGIGTNAPTATAHIKGSGSTSATTSLLVQNSSGLVGLIVTDDGSVSSYGKGGQTTNAAFGGTALGANTSGSLNAGYGYASLQFNTTGGSNTAIGFQSGYGNATGSNNTAVGRNALISVANYSDNTAVGAFADCGGFSGSVMLGKSAIATASNQFVVGSSTTNAGSIASTTTAAATFLWTVKINGTDYKILMTT